jgi:hypothetical protein
LKEIKSSPLTDRLKFTLALRHSTAPSPSTPPHVTNPENFGNNNHNHNSRQTIFWHHIPIFKNEKKTNSFHWIVLSGTGQQTTAQTSAEKPEHYDLLPRQKITAGHQVRAI